MYPMEVLQKQDSQEHGERDRIYAKEKIRHWYMCTRTWGGMEFRQRAEKAVYPSSSVVTSKKGMRMNDLHLLFYVILHCCNALQMHSCITWPTGPHTNNKQETGNIMPRDIQHGKGRHGPEYRPPDSYPGLIPLPSLNLHSCFLHSKLLL